MKYAGEARSRFFASQCAASHIARIDAVPEMSVTSKLRMCFANCSTDNILVIEIGGRRCNVSFSDLFIRD
jgi:hypothetical protein